MAMSTHTWHADASVLAAYVSGSLDAVNGASVEQHLIACGQCRGAIAGLVDSGDLTTGWDRVQDAVERPSLPAPIRLARALGLREPTAVLLTASASLRTAWVSSSVVALGFAFLASRLAEDDVLWPFLLIAPLIPVLGVAASYGPATDPLETLIITSPYGRARLILVRTLAVLTASLPVAFLLGLALPGPQWVAAAWLGPAIAMIPVLLALASFVGPRLAGSAVAIGWSALVLPAARRLPATWPVEPDRQWLFLALAVTACLVLAVRSRLTRQIGAAL
jgi:hypothetical protein